MRGTKRILKLKIKRKTYLELVHTDGIDLQSLGRTHRATGIISFSALNECNDGIEDDNAMMGLKMTAVVIINKYRARLSTHMISE